MGTLTCGRRWFDAVTACKLFELRRVAEATPQRSAADMLPQEQIDCLAGLLAAERILPRTRRGRERPAGVRTLCVYLGRLLGFIPSRRQPLPGPDKLWRGPGRPRDCFRGWQAAREFAPPAGPAAAG